MLYGTNNKNFDEQAEITASSSQRKEYNHSYCVAIFLTLKVILLPLALTPAGK